jgi:hypothetical protein
VPLPLDEQLKSLAARTDYLGASLGLVIGSLRRQGVLDDTIWRALNEQRLALAKESKTLASWSASLEAVVAMAEGRRVSESGTAPRFHFADPLPRR